MLGGVEREIGEVQFSFFLDGSLNFDRLHNRAEMAGTTTAVKQKKIWELRKEAQRGTAQREEKS